MAGSGLPVEPQLFRVGPIDCSVEQVAHLGALEHTLRIAASREDANLHAVPAEAVDQHPCIVEGRYLLLGEPSVETLVLQIAQAVDGILALVVCATFRNVYTARL